eukprot:Selendium_serpulae@DN3829_c0_g1_i1.p1
MNNHDDDGDALGVCLSREKAYLSTIATLKREILRLENSIGKPQNPHYATDDRLRFAVLDPSVELEIIDLRVKLLERDLEAQNLRDYLTEGSSFESGTEVLHKLRGKIRKLAKENRVVATVLYEERTQPQRIALNSQEKQLLFCYEQLKSIWELLCDIWEDEDCIKQLCNETAIVVAENKDLRKELEQLQKGLHDEMA